MTTEQGNQTRGPRVHIDPIGADLELEPEETIIEAAWRLGYHWPTVCHGQATCTVCHLEVLNGIEHLTPPDDEEQDALEHRLPGAHRRDLTRLRLACRARPTGDVAVRKNGVRRRQTVPTGPSLHVVDEWESRPMEEPSFIRQATPRAQQPPTGLVSYAELSGELGVPSDQDVEPKEQRVVR